MSKMGAYVLELQTKSDEDYANVQAKSLRGSGHRNKPIMGHDMVRGRVPTVDRDSVPMHQPRPAVLNTEQGGCDRGSQRVIVRPSDSQEGVGL